MSLAADARDQLDRSTDELQDVAGGAMNKMIDHLVERKAVLTKLFRSVDTDGSGDIAQELGHALSTLGLRLSRQGLRSVMNRLDSDGSGFIDLPEFLENFKKERARRALRWAYPGAQSGEDGAA
jgi:Ca2+-binding EF-hand superfamily protein